MDNTFDEQVKTKYPYSKRQIFQMFKKPVNNKDQELFTVKYSIDQIQKQIRNLSKYYPGVKVEQDIMKYQKSKTMNRKIFGSFRCQQCKNTFTSILGNYQIQFKQLKKNYFVYKSKIYRLQCKNCKKWCEGKIFQSQLQAVAKSFCLIIASILEQIPKPQIKKYDRYKLRDVHWHKEELCEACKEGKCFNIPKQQNKNSRRQSNLYENQSPFEQITDENWSQSNQSRLRNGRNYRIQKNQYIQSNNREKQEQTRKIYVITSKNQQKEIPYQKIKDIVKRRSTEDLRKRQKLLQKHPDKQKYLEFKELIKEEIENRINNQQIERKAKFTNQQSQSYKQSRQVSTLRPTYQSQNYLQSQKTNSSEIHRKTITKTVPTSIQSHTISRSNQQKNTLLQTQKTYNTQNSSFFNKTITASNLSVEKNLSTQKQKIDQQKGVFKKVMKYLRWFFRAKHQTQDG